ncbi:cation diffusion facilitator family transporter [Nocardioides sp.]|uniref:cation diffusion facilitator family transporter n=1 Tax=Nocardioides sp. TaxID=35761 RepID=UPI003D095F28
MSAPAPKEQASESLVTVVVALVANALIAVAKTVAAVFTGSASMVAEAAHSWADAGNEIFLLIAERQGRRPRDESHPRGYGRDTYIWSLFAAVGLFTAGSVVSLWHGASQLTSTSAHENYVVNYVVLAIAFVLEGISFRQAVGQTRGEAATFGLRPLSFINRTSNPTLRAVFLEDFVALIGIAFATIGIGLHQLTGNAVWDALGSIAIGVLLGAAAIFLINRNRQFLVGQTVSPELWDRALTALLEREAVERVTYLHLEYVGASRCFLVAAVDLTGDDAEPLLAVRLRRLEAEIEEREFVEDAVLTLSTPDEAALVPAVHKHL